MTRPRWISCARRGRVISPMNSRRFHVLSLASVFASDLYASFVQPQASPARSRSRRAVLCVPTEKSLLPVNFSVMELDKG